MRHSSERRWARTVAIAAGVVLAACADQSPQPDPIARIDVLPDTVTFAVGDSASLRAVAFDAHGDTVRSADIEWQVGDPALSILDGVLTSTRSVLSSVAATSRRDNRIFAGALVWVQPRAADLRLGLSVRHWSVGTTFLAEAFVQLIPSSQDVVVPVTSFVEFHALNSSNPAAIDWVAYQNDYESSYNDGFTITARSPGTSIVSFQMGGRAESLTVIVDAPVFTTPLPAEGCALTSAGEAWCSGSNSAGQLGTRTAPWRHCCGSNSGEEQQGSATAVGVDTDRRFDRLIAGTAFTCGLTIGNGAAYCWGKNDDGALGVATSDSLVAGPNGEPRCSYFASFQAFSFTKCHFKPVRVDRDLGQLLEFGDLSVQGTQVCGHVVRRGASTAALQPVDETWCWGGSYGTPPQQRPASFQ